MSAESNGHNNKSEKNDGDLDSIIENDLLNKNEKLLSVSDHLLRFVAKRLKEINERELKTNPKVYRCFHCLEFIHTILTAFVLLIKKVATCNPISYGGEQEIETIKQIYVRTMLLQLQIIRCTCNIIVFLNVCQQRKWTEQASYDSSTIVIKLEECFRYVEKRISRLERMLEEAAELLRHGFHRSGGGHREQMESDSSTFVGVEDRLKLVKLIVADCEERIWINCEKINITLGDIIKRRVLIKMMAGVIAVASGVVCSSFLITSDGPVYIRLCATLGMIVGFAFVANILGTILFKHPGKVPKEFAKYNLERIKMTKEVDDFIMSWEKFAGESLR